MVEASPSEAPLHAPKLLQMTPQANQITPPQDQVHASQQQVRQEKKLRESSMPIRPDECPFVIVKHKSRTCRRGLYRRADGTKSRYCVNHCHVDTPDLEFVSCPYEPKNRMPAHLIESHLKVCPRAVAIRKVQALPFFNKGVNFFRQEEVKSATGQPAVSPHDYQDLIIRAYESLRDRYGRDPSLAELFTVDEQMEMWEKLDEEEGQASRLLSDSMKHGNQQSNIVARMCEGKLLSPEALATATQGAMYVEYGAGKAGLSSYVAQKLAEVEEQTPFDKAKVTFVVVDRDARRYTKDKYCKGAGFAVDRHRIDIADFDLAKYAALKTSSSRGVPTVIGIAKHLCGGATDLALTSFQRLPAGQLDGLSMATCCHHTCDTKTYVNLPFITDEVGIPVSQFNDFVKCSSWAVSLQILHSPKRRAGFKLKRILDLGRILFIRGLGIFPPSQVRGLQYCNCATESLESTLILATRH